MQKRMVRRSWLLGALLTALLFLVLYRLSSFRFENSDDMLMVKPFMGFEGGVPANFTLYTHTVLAWVLYALAQFWPGIAWFSVFQMVLLGLSGTVIVKNLLLCTDGKPRLPGFAAGALYLSVFAAFIFCRVSYTTTAALAGAAALTQFFVAVRSQAPSLRAYMLSLFLVLCAYSLRVVSALPSLAFMALLLMMQWIESRKNRSARAGSPHALRTLFTAVLIFVLAFAAFAGIRQAEIRLRGLQPYLDWQEARIRLMDYTDFQTDPEPALRVASGLGAEEVEMIRQWYFMDENITTQALETLADAYNGAPQTGVWAKLKGFLADQPRYGYAAAALLLLALLCWVAQGRSAPLASLAVLLALLGTVAMLVFLSWRGRVIGRAVDAVFLPLAALLSCFALEALPSLNAARGRRIAAVLLALCFLAPATLNVNLTLHAITRPQDAVSQQREQELEQYALVHPGTLVVRSTSLLRDTRLLPDVGAGVPANITLWGDWGCRTPSWYRQLSALGFDGEAFTASDWLKENIVFAAAQPEDTHDLCAYLAAALGSPVEAVQKDGYGTLTFYRFQRSPG